MEQKEVVHAVYINGTSTMRSVLQSMLRIMDQTGEFGKYIQERYSEGETSLYRLLNQEDPVSMQFLSQKVDLNKLRSYLNEHKVSFAFLETDGGVRMYFKSKDEKLITKALQPVVKDIAKNLGDFSKKVLKKPGTMSFQERVAYAQKNQAKYQGSIKKSPTVKAPTKG